MYHNNERVGLTTSGAYGFRVNKSLAFAYVNSDLTKNDTEFLIDIQGQKIKAKIIEENQIKPYLKLHRLEKFDYKGNQKSLKILRNLVHFDTGNQIFNLSKGIIESNNIGTDENQSEDLFALIHVQLL